MHLRRAHSRPTGGARCAAHLDARLAPARVDLTDASPTKKNINSKRGERSRWRPVSPDCVRHHAVPANRRGFRVVRNPRNFGRLAGPVAVCESNSDRSLAFCA